METPIIMRISSYGQTRQLDPINYPHKQCENTETTVEYMVADVYVGTAIFKSSDFTRGYFSIELDSYNAFVKDLRALQLEML